jgi:hypothetical protein
MGLLGLRRVNARKILVEKSRRTCGGASVSSFLAKCWKHRSGNGKQDN